MSNKHDTKLNSDQGQQDEERSSHSHSRREFLRKYGKLAAITPVATTAILHSKRALASDDCTDCGFDGASNGVDWSS